MKLANLIPLKEAEGPSQREVKAFNPIAKEYLEALAKYQTLADRQKDLTKPYFSAKTEEDRQKALVNLKANQTNLSKAKDFLDRIEAKFERALENALG